MKSEQLLDAIGMLDDDLIVEAEEKVARRKLPVWQMATAAAAAVVVCAGLYILPAMQPAGMAAPESQVVSDAMADVAGGILADGALDEYKYKTGQFAVRAPSTANKDTAGETQGVLEPKFFTSQGVYLPVGDEGEFIRDKLPEDMQFLGELVNAVPGKRVYPSTGTQELVGCPVWQSEDGEYLCIRVSDGQWLNAKLYQ